MKKPLVMLTGCAMLLSISSVAYSAQGPYVSGSVGVAVPVDQDVVFSAAPTTPVTFESDNGLALGVAVGYGFANNTRVEGEIAYQKNDLARYIEPGAAAVAVTGDTSSLALLVNGYYDFKNNSPFTTFITAGIGMAKVSVSDISGGGLTIRGDDDTVFAYQVGAGVGYAVTDKVTVDVKYRYFATSDPHFEISTAEYSSHNIYAGIRVGF